MGKRARLGFILALVMLPFSALAQMGDPAEEVTAALKSLFRFDTHFSTPLERPMQYALAFEFSDALDARCPDLFPGHFQGIRDVMWAGYVHYAFENTRLERLPEGTDLFAGMAYIIAHHGAAGFPSILRRDVLTQLGTGMIADNIIAGLGGCASEPLVMMSNALYAIGTFGTLSQHEFPSTLVRRENTENGVGFVCYYDMDPNDPTLETQGYKLVSLYNIGDQSPFGQYIRALMKAAYGDQDGGNPAQIPFMRSDCPLTPDPRFNLISEFAAPEVPTGTEVLSVPEQFASYFIDAYLPQARKRFDPATLPPVPDRLLADLRQEIINFETSSLPVTDQNGREAEYKADHGNRLWELSEDGNAVGVDRYLAVRYLVMEELGY